MPKTAEHRIPRKPLSNITQQAVRKDLEANKENNFADIITNATMQDSNLTANEFARGPVAGKAASSLAASGYHATGFLPQYDGAGRAHTSTMHQQHGVPASHRQARVNLPQEGSYADRPAPLGARSHNANRDPRSLPNQDPSASSRTFGYDGSADDAPWADNTAETAYGYNNPNTSGQQKEFDTMGVTKEDFNHQRPDHKNAWHQGQVTDLFREIAEEEDSYMRTRLRQNTKTD